MPRNHRLRLSAADRVWPHLLLLLRLWCRYIVLMSDGIFEFLDSQQILAEVHAGAQAGLHPSEVAKKLVKLARQ